MNASDRTRKTRLHAPARRRPDVEPRPSAALRRSTGRDRAEWFAMLDTWGAGGRPYREIADWLTGEHGVSSWWAQKLIVEYEQARGLRDAGVRPDGTFAGGASKTIAVPVQRLFDAFVDADLRERWLPGVVLRERTSQAGRSARFDWDDDASRVNVTFGSRSATGRARSPSSMTTCPTLALPRNARPSGASAWPPSRPCWRGEPSTGVAMPDASRPARAPTRRAAGNRRVERSHRRGRAPRA